MKGLMTYFLDFDWKGYQRADPVIKTKRSNI